MKIMESVHYSESWDPLLLSLCRLAPSGLLKNKDSVHDLVNVSLFLMKKKKIEPTNLVKLGGKSCLLLKKNTFSFFNFNIAVKL